MAATARLNPETARRLAAGGRLLLMVAAVLLGHAALFYILLHARPAEPGLRPLATPLFTRLLQPEAPPPVPAAPPPAAAAPQRAPAAGALMASTPLVATATVALSAPEKPPKPVPAPRLPQARSKEPELPVPETPLAQTDASGQGVVMNEAVPRAPAAADGVLSQATAQNQPTVVETAAEVSGEAPSQPPQPMAEAAPPPALGRPPDAWPGDTRLSYALSGRFRSGELYGDARVQWQREGSRYQTRVEIDLRPWISQSFTSQGEVGAEGLRPEAYEESRRGRSRVLRLGTETLTLGNGSSVPRPPGVQDTASQFVELGHRFATGRERLEVGASVSLWLARPGGIDLWTYDIVKTEILRTAQLGDVEAFHLKPRPLANPRGNITAEMWFAPSLQYLPVRIRVTMGDEAMVDLLVNTIEQR